MFNRLSVNTLLKSVIALLAMAVVSILAVGAWESWLTTATRLAAGTDSSGELFKALHNIRHLPADATDGRRSACERSAGVRRGLRAAARGLTKSYGAPPQSCARAYRGATTLRHV